MSTVSVTKLLGRNEFSWVDFSKTADHKNFKLDTALPCVLTNISGECQLCTMASC